MSSAVHKDGRDTCDYTEMKENIKHYKEKIDEKCLCKFCGKLCISREKLGRHIRSVHKLEPSLCTHCDKSFKKKKSLQNHIFAVHNRKQCLNCGQTFKPSAHIYHIKRCQTLSCEFGDFETKIKKDFTTHKKIHEDQVVKYQVRPKKIVKKEVKSYCSLCSYCTYYKSNLKQHEKGVHGDKFYCDLCEKKFSFPYPLKDTKNLHIP